MDIEKEISKLLSKLAEIDTKLDHALVKLDDHEYRIRKIEHLTGRRFESLFMQICALLVAAFVGAVLSRLV